MIGVAIPEFSEGTSLPKLTQDMQEASAEDLKAKVRAAPNFEITGEVGDVLYLPSGFLCLAYSPHGCLGVRHSVSPPHEGEDLRVLATVAAAINTYQGLKDSAWSAWHDSLQVT